MNGAAGPIAWAARGLRGVADLPGRLVGPIFTKELRVSSRRRRNFVLRAVYLAALTAFVALVWYAAMRMASYDAGYGSHAARVERMHTAGLTVVACVVWFQFCAVLLVTVIMLSTSISEEVYHRTLGVLMTTPIHSFQIVVGKLLSKILQLVMLLALSLPVLAVVRVLGGVPWDFLIRSLCVTLSTVVLFAAVTMFISIRFRRAFVSILLALCTMAFFYGGVPLIVTLMVVAFRWDHHSDLLGLVTLLLHYNPFATQTVLTVELIEPRGAAMMGAFVWWVNCLISLGLAGLILAACVAMVRRAALRQAAGATGAGPSSSLAPAPPLRSPAIPMAGHPGLPGLPEPAEVPEPAAPSGFPTPLPVLQPVADLGRIRPIVGSPILWRELRPNWARGRTAFWVGGGIAALLLLLIYGLVGAIDNCFSESEVHAAFIFVYTILGTLVTAVLAATTITAEKEANSWEILLCTTLSDWHILCGKAAGVVRRCLPIWLLPLGHVVLFMVAGLVNPVLVVHLGLIIVSVTGLLAGSGLYFSSHFKRTTTAVILNLSLAIALWAGLPGFLVLGAEAMGGRRSSEPLHSLTECTIDANPVFQATMVTGRTTGRRARKADVHYHWEAAGSCSLPETLAYLTMFTGIYLSLGAAFAWRAKCRLRKKIY
jgi:ABC-type transport system involved in multi-copper enzyme maturation permease subunit